MQFRGHKLLYSKNNTIFAAETNSRADDDGDKEISASEGYNQ